MTPTEKELEIKKLREKIRTLHKEFKKLGKTKPSNFNEKLNISLETGLYSGILYRLLLANIFCEMNVIASQSTSVKAAEQGSSPEQLTL